LLVTLMTLITAWRVPGIPKFRLGETESHPATRNIMEDERATG
jgi:hypothetical protein